MHRTKVKVAADALDANQTIARANRDDFDRAGRRGGQLHERARGGKTSLLEGALPGLDGVRVGCSRATSRGAMDADRIAALHVPVVQLNTESGFGGECHLDANMVRSALDDLPLDDSTCW